MSGQDSRLDRLASFLLDSNRTVFAPVSEGADRQHNDACGSKRKFETEGECHAKIPERIPIFAGCLINGALASSNAWRFEVEKHDICLLDFPQLHENMQMMNTSQGRCFDLCLARTRLASRVLDHCIAMVRRVSTSPFKIGITSNPYVRWYNSEFGYSAEGVYTTLIVVAILRTMEAATYLESALIREFKQYRYCHNLAPGGEGVSSDSELGFVYVVCSTISRRTTDRVHQRVLA